MNLKNCINNSLQQILINEIQELTASNNSDKILLLLTNNNLSDNFDFLKKDIVEIKYFDNFIQNILTKTVPNNLNIISDFISIQIIHSISKREMAQNNALKNLCKSTSFSRELYNLFGLFKSYRVTTEELLNINLSKELSKEDSSRFEIIINIYDKYNEFLSKNKFLDYRDIILKAISVINQNETLKSILTAKYSHIFVYSAQDLTPLHLEFLKLLNKNVKLFADKNSAIQGFKGVINFDKKCKNVIQAPIKRNDFIFERASFIVEKEASLTTKKYSSVQYRLFSDFQNEINYIADDIKQEIKNGTKPCDIAIITRDNSVKQKLTDILNVNEIPVNAALYSEDFQLFKYRFNCTLSMFQIFETLNFKEINFKNFININHSSKVEKEIFAEQLNLYWQNVLSEIFENKYSVNELCLIQEQTGDLFLIETAYKNQNILSETDKKNLLSKISEINNLYQLYLKNDYINIVLKIADIHTFKDENYNKFIAKYLSKLKQLQELNSKIAEEKLKYTTLLELFEMTLEENDTSVEKINLITCFKAAGRSYKKVYLPSLTDGYFPKRAKSTFFITNSANKIISRELNKIHLGFGNLIKSNFDEIEDEKRLFYTVMNCAEEKIFISTHKYENKTQSQASTFFEQLMFADKENFLSDEIKKTEEIHKKQREKNEITDTNIEIVLPLQEILFLSASSISTFLKCPKQFYLKHVLGLKEVNTYSATYGTIVHAVFELCFTKYLNEFSKEKILELGDILFNSKIDNTNAKNAGFKEKITEQIKELSNLEFIEMQENFKNAVNSIQDTFFEEKPTEAVCEKSFEFSIPEIENVKFSGKIDLILKYSDGYKLIDYKTGKNKQKLSAIISEAGINFISNAGKSNACFSEEKVKKYEYQIPLYFLACLYSEDLLKYKDKIKSAGYLYIRPKYKDGGYEKDFISADEINQYKDKIIENIKVYVVDKIRERTFFEGFYEEYNCGNCQYTSICNIKKEED